MAFFITLGVQNTESQSNKKNCLEQVTTINYKTKQTIAILKLEAGLWIGGGAIEYQLPFDQLTVSVHVAVNKRCDQNKLHTVGIV